MHKRSEIKGTYLAAFLPNLRVLSTENLRIKLPVFLHEDGACICLPANLDALVICEINVHHEGVGAERVDVQGQASGEYRRSSWLWLLAAALVTVQIWFFDESHPRLTHLLAMAEPLRTTFGCY